MSEDRDALFKTRLRNKLEVRLKEVHTAPLISSWVWYRVGSRNEHAGITGISHWVEHMQFRGTPTFPAGVLDLLQQPGGGHDQPRRAVAALHRPFFDEGLLHRMQPALVRQTLDGRHAAAVGARRGHQAALHRQAIQPVHHAVKQDQIGGFLLDPCESLFSGFDEIEPVARIGQGVPDNHVHHR